MQEAAKGELLDGYMSREEVAKELGVNPRTLDRWHQMREGPPRTRIGKKVVYARTDVAGWIEANREATPDAGKIRRRSRGALRR